PVRRGNDDDALILGEAVEIDGQLVERLLALFVAERVAAAAASGGVELVDEHNTGLMTPGVAEQPADARRADARLHLDELGSSRARGCVPTSPGTAYSPARRQTRAPTGTPRSCTASARTPCGRRCGRPCAQDRRQTRDSP